jgi:NAD(P)-dependent dehydrogenase (short-subunit alcohol dehydrogenase family)
VTGAAKRLGRTIALALADRGSDVVVHYHQSAEQAEATCSAIREKGQQAWPMAADLSDPTAAEGLVVAARQAAGPLSTLINNASIFPQDTLPRLDAASFAQNLQINALSPLALAMAFAGQVHEEGSIINLTDSRVVGFDQEHVGYHLSKRMLWTLTRLMADSLAPKVRVNAVAPGAVLPPAGADRAYLAARAAEAPLRRIGSPSDVAEAVCYLAGAAFVTGQVIFVDGGRHMEGNRYV